MGDASSVVNCRMEDLCQEKVLDLKDPRTSIENEECTLEKPAGEPGEIKHRIIEIISETNDDFNETAASEPLLAESKMSPFSDNDTKQLRSDAPAFVPECTTLISEIAHEESEMCNDFVNVDLRPSLPEDQEFPESEYPAIPKVHKEIKEIKELKDPGLKPFSLTSTPRVKKSLPKIEIPTMEEEEVTINVVVPSSQVATTSQPTGHCRILSVNFLIENRTQIAVLIVSLVICTILIVYVLIR